MFGLFSYSVKITNNIRSNVSLMKNRLLPISLKNANSFLSELESPNKLGMSLFNNAFVPIVERSIFNRNSTKDFLRIQKCGYSNYNYNYNSKRKSNINDNYSDNNYQRENKVNANNRDDYRSSSRNDYSSSKRNNYNNNNSYEDRNYDSYNSENSNNASSSSYNRTSPNKSRSGSYNYKNQDSFEQRENSYSSNNRYNNRNSEESYSRNNKAGKGELTASPQANELESANFSNYDFSKSKYYMEKNIPETFQSKSEKLDLAFKDPNLKRMVKDTQTSLSFRQMNFLEEIYTILDKLEIISPTSIQNIAIPKILEKKNIFFASQTGMGKTLAYLLPIINELKLQELQLRQRLTKPKRPRVLILAPSRELCQQIEEVIKLFVFDLPLVVESFYVGKPFGTEKKYASKGVDILISTPDRFKNHWGKNNVFITGITHLVIDELDTFLDAGYAEFIYDLSRKLLRKQNKGDAASPGEFDNHDEEEGEMEFNVNYEGKFGRNKKEFVEANAENLNKQNEANDNENQINKDRLKDQKNPSNEEHEINEESAESLNNKNKSLTQNPISKSALSSKETKPAAQLIYASTTLTRAIDRFLDSIFAEELSQPVQKHSGEANFVKIIDKSTNHNLSNIKHEFLQVTDFDKYPTLLKILNDNKKILKQNYSIILFVNSIVCARKTEMFLAENGYETSCLHGEIPPLRRKFELEKFKKRRAKILVTTDLIARGLDFPFVYLVINFDFPGNVSDYIHRAGRTGRAGRKGFVISFFRKYNIDLIEEIKKSNANNTPLLTEGSMFSKRNKEDLALQRGASRKRITHGLKDKSLKLHGSRLSDGEKSSLITKIKLRKERIDKMKAQMVKEKKEKIRILDAKYNRKHRNTNRNNTYGNRFAKRNKK